MLRTTWGGLKNGRNVGTFLDTLNNNSIEPQIYLSEPASRWQSQAERSVSGMEQRRWLPEWWRPVWGSELGPGKAGCPCWLPKCERAELRQRGTRGGALTILYIRQTVRPSVIAGKSRESRRILFWRGACRDRNRWRSSSTPGRPRAGRRGLRSEMIK